MSDTDTWFLLVQHKRAERTDVTAFDDQAEAAVAYGEAERRYEEKIHNGRSTKVRKLLAGLPTVPAF